MSGDDEMQDSHFRDLAVRNWTENRISLTQNPKGAKKRLAFFFAPFESLRETFAAL